MQPMAARQAAVGQVRQVSQCAHLVACYLSCSDELRVSGVCLVLELREDGGRREEPCGRAAEHQGLCQMHYKERLVELINRCRADPVVLFSPAEMKAELQRWNVATPTRKPEEQEPLYIHRLRLTLTNSIPLRRRPRPLTSDLCSNSWSSASSPADQ
ncbi:E3 ubiquitin-protein ligase RNF31-like [Plectropomus leopardus]|uniref:E3 ubiquitin-protein ligase RNF31-like n=1 Tax=Plectropomus leopardus TaxID=160734 RepID=UPI001C4B6FC5|nr:E3 ubiquitin-protein ligase RNF31-like [Plectropomus leopardus]